jgi:hypothetical protein
VPAVPRQTPCIADDHSATTAAYRRGCSCDGAREAWRQHRADYNTRRRDPGYRGIKGAGPMLPVTRTERTVRSAALRARNIRLAVGARRKLRSLMRIGHSRPFLAGELKMSLKSVSTICGGSANGGIWPRTADAVDALYRKLRYTVGDNTATISNAERLGYLPPHAWDGADIDDPSALPRWSGLPVPRSATA